MAKAKISILDIECVRAMIDLLVESYDDLPHDLQVAIRRVCDSEHFEIGINKLNQMNIDHTKVKVVVDGVQIDRVVSFNPALKRVTRYWESGGELHAINDDILDIYLWPKSVDIVVDGVKVPSLGW